MDLQCCHPPLSPSPPCCHPPAATYRFTAYTIHPTHLRHLFGRADECPQRSLAPPAPRHRAKDAALDHIAEAAAVTVLHLNAGWGWREWWGGGVEGVEGWKEGGEGWRGWRGWRGGEGGGVGQDNLPKHIHFITVHGSLPQSIILVTPATVVSHNDCSDVLPGHQGHSPGCLVNPPPLSFAWCRHSPPPLLTTIAVTCCPGARAMVFATWVKEACRRRA